MNNKRTDDLDLDFEIKEMENEWGFTLKEYDVEYPSESEMMRTIDALRPYVPIKENKWITFWDNLTSILKHSYKEIFYISPVFWLLNSLFLGISMAAIFASEISPYTVVILLAPIPTITGLLEVMKSKYSGFAELEMSFKYSMQEIILSKMIVIGVFNLMINLMVTISISSFYQEVWLGKLMLYWMTPFTVITAISFLIVNRIRHVYGVTSTLIIWIGFGSLINQEHIFKSIESVPVIFYVLIIVLSFAAILYQVKQLYKRGVHYEFNH